MFTRCAHSRSFLLGTGSPLNVHAQSAGVNGLRDPGALGLGASPRSSAPGPRRCRMEGPLPTGRQKPGSGPGPAGKQFTAPLVRKLWGCRHHMLMSLQSRCDFQDVSGAKLLQLFTETPGEPGCGACRPSQCWVLPEPAACPATTLPPPPALGPRSLVALSRGRRARGCGGLGTCG